MGFSLLVVSRNYYVLSPDSISSFMSFHRHKVWDDRDVDKNPRLAKSIRAWIGSNYDLL